MGLRTLPTGKQSTDVLMERVMSEELISCPPLYWILAIVDSIKSGSADPVIPVNILSWSLEEGLAYV